MAKIFAFLAAVLGFGALLAWASLDWGLSTGWIGAGALIGWAVLARRHWDRLRATVGTEPGGPERIVWHRLAGTGILFGHMIVALASPGVDLHLGSGNTLAIDSWTILLGMGLSAIVFRGDAHERDERHHAIAARGVRAGYAALIVLLIILLFYLGFAPPDARQPLTHWVLANLLSGLIVTSVLAMHFVQLLGYAPDGRAPSPEHLDA
jgi:hypothetical protein